MTSPDTLSALPGQIRVPVPPVLGFSQVEVGPRQNGGHVWFGLRLRRVCQFCLVMPLMGLVICLLVALVFQFEHIQETACKVRNVVPSISAVTGISPGRYVWRMVIAFHIGPRIIAVLAFYHFLVSFTNKMDLTMVDSQAKKVLLERLLKGIWVLQVLEIIGLCCISFIHNREHYPIHEKGFILYITSSHFTFLLVIWVYHIIWPHLSSEQQKSYRLKVGAFLFSFSCIVVMSYFYYRHIVFCDNYAFSVFAFVEYFVATANMYFYWTIVYDLPDEEIVIWLPMKSSSSEDSTSNGHATSSASGIKKQN